MMPVRVAINPAQVAFVVRPYTKTSAAVALHGMEKVRLVEETFEPGFDSECG
jgi:hypothetical protein